MKTRQTVLIPPQEVGVRTLRLPLVGIVIDLP